ncbi:MAG: hypothetical protein LBU14_00795 [Candidatus Peribacteria bacterium]|nr:hypothetical protein [Candidatus Peribacteria bacterium]
MLLFLNSSFTHKSATYLHLPKIHHLFLIYEAKTSTISFSHSKSTKAEKPITSHLSLAK